MPFVDVSLYVMTPEFGAASQLEKIDMLDFADVVAINKFERRGAEDALRDVARQLVRNREAFGQSPEDMPVFGTSAATFNDDGVTALYQHLRDLLAEHGPAPSTRAGCRASTRKHLERHRQRHPARRGCATSPRSPRPSAATTPRPSGRSRRRAERQRLRDGRGRAADGTAPTRAELVDVLRGRRAALPAEAAALLDELARASSRPTPATSMVVTRPRPGAAHPAAPARRCRATQVRRVALPALRPTTASCCGSCARENLPGQFPFTAGVFPFKREGEDPARMFAGEGDAVPHQPALQATCPRAADATRLSTAFDSVTLYGRDPDTAPDVYGKVGTSGRLDRDARRHEGPLRRLRPRARRPPRCR